MVKYLQMDGVDDRFVTPTTTTPVKYVYLRVNIIDVSNGYLIDYRTTVSKYFAQSANNFNGNLIIDGTSYLTEWGNLSKASGKISEVIVNADTTTTGKITLFGRYTGISGSDFLQVDVYDIKLHDANNNLVAHYDMSTGTVQDQSGNGNHATLTGGTWLDDGTGGTPTGEDGSALFSLSQKIYSDENTPYTTNQTIHQDDSSSYLSKQIIFEDLNLSFATLQEIFNDGQIGSVAFSLLLKMYSDESTQSETRQLYYDGGLSQLSTSQLLYENNQMSNSTKQIIYSDSFTQYDSIQKIYSDISSGYVTKQSIYDANSFTLNTLQQLFEHSSMNLQTKQSIYHLDTVELLTLQSIYEDNSMSMDTLQQFLSDYVEYRQVFKYLLGINRQSKFELGIVGNQKFGVDISDRIIKYDLNVSDQVKKYDLNI